MVIVEIMRKEKFFGLGVIVLGLFFLVIKNDAGAYSLTWKTEVLL